MKYAIENGIIDLSYVHEKYNMLKREKILEMHKTPITEGKDGYWRTYLPDDKKGRRQIKRKNRSDIEEIVIKYYQDKEKECKNTAQYTFKNRFLIWVERQKMCERSDNTIYKYQTDYNRFFANRKIENMDIRKITESDIISMFKTVLQEKEIPYRALKSAFGYVNGVFEKSIIDKMVSTNPCIYVDLPLLKKYCTEKSNHTAEKRTISDADSRKVFRKLEKSSNIAKYAVELAFCTGMRVGELAALRWADISYPKRCITICSSEKYNRLTKQYYIEETKNRKIRTIPLTDGMKDVLERTWKHEEKNGWLSDFVFSGENGRVHTRTISEWIRNNTMTREFESPKSIHAIRRTINSNMRCAGVPVPVAASILGHTEKVNEENYTYNITSMEKRLEILNDASQYRSNQK